MSGTVDDPTGTPDPSAVGPAPPRPRATHRPIKRPHRAAGEQSTRRATGEQQTTRTGTAEQPTTRRTAGEQTTTRRAAGAKERQAPSARALPRRAPGERLPALPEPLPRGSGFAPADEALLVRIHAGLKALG